MLELPSATGKKATPTRFTAIESLENSFELVDGAEFVRAMEESGSAVLHEDRRTLPGVKLGFSIHNVGDVAAIVKKLHHFFAGSRELGPAGFPVGILF